MKRAVKKPAVMIRYKSGEFGIKITTPTRTDVDRIRRLPGRFMTASGKKCPGDLHTGIREAAAKARNNK